MKNISQIVIDPQNGFCSPSGSLSLHYGKGELYEIRAIIPKIAKSLTQCQRRHLVISEYSLGQFTQGNFNHNLARLCVPDMNTDCDVIEEFSAINFDSITIKHQQNAFSNDDFFKLIDNELKLGMKHFLVTGFLLEHCVKATVEALIQVLKNHEASVYLCRDLTASRLTKYSNDVVSSTYKGLLEIGVKITSSRELFLV